MKTNTLAMATTLAAALLTAPLSQAQTIEVGVSKQAPELQNISRPHNGMDKSEVEAIYGAPYAVSGPVGEPPITSWSYEKFTVYFEHDTVLHSVLKKQAPAPAGQ
ncbi:MAG: hypothetical protein R3E62_11985 [Pseudomonadales bacterium]|jgi:hypothetical protein